MSALETAKDAWGNPPDWIIALAMECDRSSQNQVARRLERSAPVISGVLRNTYRGSMETVEDIVRGTLLKETIACPVLGEIEKQHCRKWRGRSRKFANTNSQSVTMYRACNRCEHNVTEDQE
ncbi:hypothetical protein O4H53_24130 [Sulfitobacter sp. G21635-S1]|uniref:hypothetical protein n=1 Tax=Sulfitobacter sp. G21635-S1 TaxID=3014043 RepID=UPI0022AFEAE4|nr:hypothetical protein [Sulfitobacter sp. G21635-S1]MCZ4258641.1 hypothetical protein [Sulfitobacter sp. G21635-S1]